MIELWWSMDINTKIVVIYLVQCVIIGNVYSVINTVRLCFQIYDWIRNLHFGNEVTFTIQTLDNELTVGDHIAIDSKVYKIIEQRNANTYTIKRAKN